MIDQISIRLTIHLTSFDLHEIEASTNITTTSHEKKECSLQKLEFRREGSLGTNKISCQVYHKYLYFYSLITNAKPTFTIFAMNNKHKIKFLQAFSWMEDQRVNHS